MWSARTLANSLTIRNVEAGYGPVRNYYCGWSEWSAAQDAPIETPAEEPSSDESSEQPADESQTGE